MIGCVDCELGGDYFQGKTNWKPTETNQNTEDDEEEFWDCIGYDDEFMECIQNTPERAMVIYVLKEMNEEVRNRAAEEEIGLMDAAEEIVEGIVLGGGKREMVQEMKDLVSAGKWKTKREKTRNQRKKISKAEQPKKPKGGGGFGKVGRYAALVESEEEVAYDICAVEEKQENEITVDSGAGKMCGQGRGRKEAR